jgi:hypothetical protein
MSAKLYSIHITLTEASSSERGITKPTDIPIQLDNAMKALRQKGWSYITIVATLEAPK